jgi:hypothetical protein
MGALLGCCATVGLSQMCLFPLSIKRRQLSKFILLSAGGRGRDFAPADDSLSCSCKKVSKEHYPIVCVPALRSGQTCVTPFSLRCGKTRCVLTHSAQTRCRKSDHDALALSGANARSPNSVPQAQPDGWNGCGWPARVMTKLASSAYSDCGNSSQKYKETIWLLAPSIAPCAHVCDGSLLWRAVAPQSATASSSLLRQRV